MDSIYGLTFRALALRQREKKPIYNLSDEGPMLETLDHTIRIGSTPTFLYFDLYTIDILYLRDHG